MGNVLRSKSFNEKFVYEITSKLSNPITVKTEVRYITPNTMGVFTPVPITKGTFFVLDNEDSYGTMRDYMFSIGNLTDSHSDDNFYHRWLLLEKYYHNVKEVQTYVNCKYVSTRNTVGLIALKDIPANTELFRCKGFSLWLLISKIKSNVVRTLQHDNIGGFIHYLKDYISRHPQDLFYKELVITHDILLDHIPYLRNRDVFESTMMVVISEINKKINTLPRGMV
jgi:hypothetical protein